MFEPRIVQNSEAGGGGDLFNIIERDRSYMISVVALSTTLTVRQTKQLTLLLLNNGQMPRVTRTRQAGNIMAERR